RLSRACDDRPPARALRSPIEEDKTMAQHPSGPPGLEGQVALITGAAGGMGRAVSNTFLAAGAHVVGTDIGDDVDLGEGIEYLPYDVTSRADTDRVVDDVLARHGRIDILVLCAGIIARTPLAESSDEEWDAMFAVNVRGVVNPARKLFPIMCERGYGKILAAGR